MMPKSALIIGFAFLHLSLNADSFVFSPPSRHSLVHRNLISRSFEANRAISSAKTTNQFGSFAVGRRGAREVSPTYATNSQIEEKPKSNAPGWMPTKTELKKLLPLGLMFFCILFNYTILRDTKDVLVITAPGSGAEVIPFLKTYVQLPGAILFTVLYSKMSNRMSQKQVFNTVLYSFLAFFASFAFVIYPNSGWLHPHAFVDVLATKLPASFSGPLSIIRNWSFALCSLLGSLE